MKNASKIGNIYVSFYKFNDSKRYYENLNCKSYFFFNHIDFENTQLILRLIFRANILTKKFLTKNILDVRVVWKHWRQWRVNIVMNSSYTDSEELWSITFYNIYMLNINQNKKILYVLVNIKLFYILNVVFYFVKSLLKLITEITWNSIFFKLFTQVFIRFRISIEIILQTHS